METEEIQRLGEKIIYQYIKHCENKKMEDILVNNFPNKKNKKTLDKRKKYVKIKNNSMI